MTPDEFQAVSRDLPAPAQPGQLEAREVTPASGVWVAKDSSDRQHLLVQVPDETRLDLPGTHGLDVHVTRHRVPQRPDATYIDLACLDPAVAGTFAAVAADIANQAVPADLPSRLSEVVTALNEWRWFWGAESGPSLRNGCGGAVRRAVVPDPVGRRVRWLGSGVARLRRGTARLPVALVLGGGEGNIPIRAYRPHDPEP